MTKKTVIGITGMPGAGKNLIREVAEHSGYPIIVMGDEIRAEAKRRNIEPTPKNLGKIMLQLRAKEGPAVIAKKCIPKIRASATSVVVVDGIRSLDEVREFRKEFPDFRMIAIYASPETRFKRLLRRGRSDDPKNCEIFIERDNRELSVGLGEVVAAADYVVNNEGTRSSSRRQLRHIFRQVTENEHKR